MGAEKETSESDESSQSGSGQPSLLSPLSEGKVLLPARSEGPEPPRSSVKRRSESPDRRDEASERADQSRQEMAETDLDTPMPPTDAEIPTPFGCQMCTLT